MDIWFCLCGLPHAEEEDCCNKCGLKQDETKQLRYFVTIISLGSTKYTSASHPLIEIGATYIGGVNIGGDTNFAAAPDEVQWKAKVRCKNSSCKNEEWVDWNRRHDSKCGKCWNKAEFTGFRDKKESKS